MKDKVKTALKRAASGLMAVLLAVCLVGTPKADAVVLEGSYLGSVFGTVLSSLGYSWASDNMGNAQFGEAIYSLMTDWASEKSDDEQTYLNNLADWVSTGLVVAGQGKLQLSYNIMNLARDFAEWFQQNYFSGESTVSKVINANNLVLINGMVGSSGSTLDYPYTVNYVEGHGALEIFSYQVTEPCKFVFVPTNADWSGICLNEVRLRYQNKIRGQCLRTGSDTVLYEVTQEQVKAGISLELCIYDLRSSMTSGEYSIGNRGIDIYIGEASTLTAEKPAEVHYPDVAEDGSQVYEITVDGVTATDIEGIIQGAVDRILAGTAAIAGSIADAQAKPGEEVANPEIDPYKVGLSSVFPFCIPFDVYNMVTMFVAEPEAPSAEWTFTLPWSSQQYSVGWDLSDFDGVARICRDMQLVLFAVGLAVITYKVIKW